jgi:hypothetical protein
LRKKYIGKTPDELRSRKIAKQLGTTRTIMKKSKFIAEMAQKGNIIAQKYIEKLKNGSVSVDWAYKVLRNSVEEERISKIIIFAEQKHLNHNSIDELIELIASEMRKQRLDPTNEDDFDSYLNPQLA